MTGDVIQFPNTTYWCFFCGVELREEHCVFSCKTNGHMSSMIVCEACLEKKKKKDGVKP